MNGNDECLYQLPSGTDKSGFGSLVFSTDCYFLGLLEDDTVSEDFERWTDRSAEYVICQHLPQLDELCPATLSRVNPSSVYFTIEKHASRGVSYNIYFDSLAMSSSFHVTDSLLKYFVLVLNPKSPPRTLIIILAFKNDDHFKKCICNLSYCVDEFFASADKPKRFAHYNKEFLYSGILVSVNAEIYEFHKKKSISLVPRENQVYKIRKNTPKIFEINFCPLRNFEFCVDRCFGFLYSLPNSSRENMNVFDDFSFSPASLSDDDRKGGYSLQSTVLNNSHLMMFLNQLEDKDTVNLSCAADFVVKGIASPIRFNLNYKIKIFSDTHMFWIENYQKMWSDYVVCLKREHGSTQFDSTFVSITEIERNAQKNVEMEQNVAGVSSPAQIDGQFTNDGEVVLSGTFPFEPDISDDLKTEWKTIFEQWVNTKECPMNVQRLLKHGIPSHFRKKVWSMLMGIFDDLPFTEDQYKNYLEQPSQYEKVIERDVTRTFTCHEFYKEKDGPGQVKLFNVCKAYSNYDKEIGYCQGMSFIVANLLLYMDELLAFCMLIQIMYRMGHRTMFGQSFDELQSFVYVFKRLINIHVPDLYQHFNHLGIDPQMFAPQWFLTLFSSKFPLGMIDLCFDMYFSQGQRSLLQISVAMLMMCQQDVIGLNFENTLKYLSINQPKRFCSPSAAKDLIQLAYSLNFTPSSFEQLQLEFQSYKKELVKTLDPYELKKIENRMLIDGQMRLEQENALLAHQLVEIKVQCNDKILDIEHKNSILTSTIESLLGQLTEITQSVSALKSNEVTLLDETKKLKEEKSELELTKNQIIEEYKKKYEEANRKTKEYDFKLKIYSNLFEIIDKNCPNCAALIKENLSTDDPRLNVGNSIADVDSLESKLHNLEMELAVAKLKIAESEACNENLQFQISEYNQKNKKWFKY